MHLSSCRRFAFAVLFVAMPSSDSPAANVDAHGDALPPRSTMRIGTTRFRHGDTVTAASLPMVRPQQQVRPRASSPVASPRATYL